MRRFSSSLTLAIQRKSAWWPFLLFVAVLGMVSPAGAQQGELPTGAPEGPPVPITPPVKVRAPIPSIPASSVPGGTLVPLPESGDGRTGTPTTAAVSDDGSQTLFGNGKPVVPTVTRRIPYSFSLSISGAYDDSTSLSSRDSSGDFYFTIAPSFVLGLDNLTSAKGNYLHFFYSPSVSLYVDRSENDSVQHIIGLETAYRFGQFGVSLRQDVEILDGTNTAQTSAGPGSVLLPGQTAGSTPIFTTGTINETNLDVSARSQLDVYDTSLAVSYGYSDKTSFGLGLQYAVDAYADLISSQSASASLSFDYVYDLKTSFGLGFSGGRTFVERPSPDQTFEQINLRGSYRYSSSLGLAGSVGLSFTESDARSGADVTPVFALSLSYRASDSTSLSLSATRSEQSSAVLVAQNFDSTSFNLSLQQVLNSRVSMGVTLGYTNSSYVSEADNVRADREENYYSVSPSISINLRPGVTLSLFYARRQSSSSGVSGRSFSDNQAGFSVGFAF